MGTLCLPLSKDLQDAACGSGRCLSGCRVRVPPQPGKPCNAPPQWQGKLERRDDSKNFTEKAMISYDLTNKRVREIEMIEEGSNKTFYERLYLHSVDKYYKIDLKTKNCTVGQIERPFPVAGIPPNANYRGTGVIGPYNEPNEHVTVMSFDGEDTGRDGEKIKYFTEVTVPDCVPVTSGMYTDKIGFVKTFYFDITAGIADPMVFIPPSNCKAV